MMSHTVPIPGPVHLLTGQSLELACQCGQHRAEWDCLKTARWEVGPFPAVCGGGWHCWPTIKMEA